MMTGMVTPSIVSSMTAWVTVPQRSMSMTLRRSSVLRQV
jgi:hypothetical protein